MAPGGAYAPLKSPICLPTGRVERLLRAPPCLLLLAVDARGGRGDADEEREEGVEVARDEVGWRGHFGGFFDYGGRI